MSGVTSDKHQILMIDYDRNALEAVRDGLREEYAVLEAATVSEACRGIETYPRIRAVVVTVNDRSDNHAAMLRLQCCAGDRPIVFMLGYPRGATAYVPPDGLKPFGLIHKGDSIRSLTAILERAVRASQPLGESPDSAS